MANKITIAELDLDVNSLIKSTTDVKAVIDQLREAQKQLTKDGDTASEQFVQNSADLKVLTQAYNANLKAIADSTNAKAEEANRTQLVSLALQTEVTSIKEAREQNSLLNKLRNETNVTTVEGKKQLDELNAKLNQNNDFIKENADQYLQQKINIGNYSDSIKDALSNLNPLNGGLAGFTQRAQEAGGVLPLLGNGLNAVTTGIYGMVKASLTFLATPIGAVIGAIGLVLGGLITYLKSTQEGIDKITAVTRPLMAIFDSLIGVVQKVGKGLFEAFSNPKKTLEELADFVKQNLINRFTAFGKILEGIINLDFKAVTDGVLQAGTGVENLTDKIADGAKATGKFLDDAAKKGAEIDRLQKEIEKGQIAFEKNTISINNALDEQELIAKDTSLSFEERAKASQEIIRLTTELGNEEAKIIEKKIKQLEIQQSLNDTSREGQLELIELRKQLDDAQDRGVEAEKEQLRVLAGLKKEQQAQAVQAEKEAEALRQKALDGAVAKQKAELDLFLSSQGVKAKSLDEQLKIAEQTKDKQIELARLEFEASKKTEVDKLNFKKSTNDANNALLKTQTDLVIANAENELEQFKNLNQSKIDAKKFLSDAIVAQEKDRYARLLKEQLEFEALRLKKGVITQEQYNQAVNQIKTDNDAKLKALRVQKEEAEKERKAIDLENQRIEQNATFEAQLAQQTADLKRAREVELANAEKTGADKALINKKYDNAILQSKTALKNTELTLTADTLGKIRGLLKENTVFAKTLAIAEATINTYLGATKALATLPPPYGAIQAGVTIATGLAQVAKISGVNQAFAGGGFVEAKGKSHAQGGIPIAIGGQNFGTMQGGEGLAIMNKGAFGIFKAFNSLFGDSDVKGSRSGHYASGAIIARGMDSSVGDLQELAVLTANAVSQLPAPIVTVEDINTVGNRVAVIENGANFG